MSSYYAYQMEKKQNALKQGDPAQFPKHSSKETGSITSPSSPTRFSKVYSQNYLKTEPSYSYLQSEHSSKPEGEAQLKKTMPEINIYSENFFTAGLNEPKNEKTAMLSHGRARTLTDSGLPQDRPKYTSGFLGQYSYFNTNTPPNAPTRDFSSPNLASPKHLAREAKKEEQSPTKEQIISSLNSAKGSPHVSPSKKKGSEDEKSYFSEYNFTAPKIDFSTSETAENPNLYSGYSAIIQKISSPYQKAQKESDVNPPSEKPKEETRERMTSFDSQIGEEFGFSFSKSYINPTNEHEASKDHYKYNFETSFGQNPQSRIISQAHSFSKIETQTPEKEKKLAQSLQETSDLLNTEKNKAIELETLIKDQKKEIEALNSNKAENVSLKKVITSQSNELEQLKIAIDKLRVDSGHSESKLSFLQKENLQLTQANKELSEEVSLLRQNDKSQKVSLLENELSESKKEKSQLIQKLAKAQEDVEMTKKEIGGLKIYLNTLLDQNNKLKAQSPAASPNIRGSQDENSDKKLIEKYQEEINRLREKEKELIQMLHSSDKTTREVDRLKRDSFELVSKINSPMLPVINREQKEQKEEIERLKKLVSKYETALRHHDEASRVLSSRRTPRGSQLNASKLFSSKEKNQSSETNGSRAAKISELRNKKEEFTKLKNIVRRNEEEIRKLSDIENDLRMRLNKSYKEIEEKTAALKSGGGYGSSGYYYGNSDELENAKNRIKQLEEDNQRLRENQQTLNILEFQSASFIQEDEELLAQYEQELDELYEKEEQMTRKMIEFEILKKEADKLRKENKELSLKLKGSTNSGASGVSTEAPGYLSRKASPTKRQFLTQEQMEQELEKKTQREIELESQIEKLKSENTTLKSKAKGAMGPSLFSGSLVSSQEETRKLKEKIGDLERHLKEALDEATQLRIQRNRKVSTEELQEKPQVLLSPVAVGAQFRLFQMESEKRTKMQSGTGEAHFNFNGAKNGID